MSYIPKSAQRKMNGYKRMKALPTTSAPATPTGPPKRLKQGQPGAGMWDVYFNGERQRLCKVADVDKGMIERYMHGDGSKPLTHRTEILHGVVQIVAKGEKPAHQHKDECWEPDSGCDMGRSEAHAVAVEPSVVLAPDSRPRHGSPRRRVALGSNVLAAATVAAIALGEMNGKDR